MRRLPLFQPDEAELSALFDDPALAFFVGEVRAARVRARTH
jgi:hypothetical protein